MTKIGFIGASGLMGHGMARNLLRKGHSVRMTVHRNRDRVSDLFEAGALEAPSPGALAAESEVVFLCVTGSPEVESLFTAPDGLLARPRKGLVVVDCSTSEPASTARLRELCEPHGIALVDAPLTRSAAEAEAGRLNVMVGATPEQFCLVEPLLRCFAENVVHVGGPGSGHTVKLLYNFLAQAICTSTAEAFAVGQRAGIDLKALVQVTSMGAVNSGLFQAMAQTLAGNLESLPFAIDNARKDLRYYTRLAESVTVPTWLGEAVHQSLTLACALGYGASFVPALVQAQEKTTGAVIVPATGGQPPSSAA
jgi:3-hydroxyisobutyrate dehydrogenase-like beta-hydroxyacid dehydrogenase